jgi:hypothetical protein
VVNHSKKKSKETTADDGEFDSENEYIDRNDPLKNKLIIEHVIEEDDLVIGFFKKVYKQASEEL